MASWSFDPDSPSEEEDVEDLQAQDSDESEQEEAVSDDDEEDVIRKKKRSRKEKYHKVFESNWEQTNDADILALIRWLNKVLCVDHVIIRFDICDVLFSKLTSTHSLHIPCREH
jgi:hypothetical protein